MANPFLVLGGIAVGIITATVGVLTVPGWVADAQDAAAMNDLGNIRAAMATAASTHIRVASFDDLDDGEWGQDIQLSDGVELTGFGHDANGWCVTVKAASGNHFAASDRSSTIGAGATKEVAADGAGCNIVPPHEDGDDEPPVVEDLLEAFRPGADDDTPLTLASSLRSVVGYVIDTAVPGEVLEPGPDANVTPYWAVTNLIVNPSFETNTTGVNASAGASSPTVSTAVGGVIGSKSMRWTTTASDSNVMLGGWDGVTATKTAKVTPGEVMTASVYLRSSMARPALLRAGFRTEAGTSLPITFDSATKTTSTTEWTRYDVTFTVPDDARYAYLIARASGNTASQYHYADGLMLHKGRHLPDVFDGTTAADANYTYAWSSTAHASTSVRTPKGTDRDPDALIWNSGQTATEFLDPLLTSTGFELNHSDGKWTLTNE